MVGLVMMRDTRARRTAMVPIHVRGTEEYDARLAALSRRGEADLARVEPQVRAILEAIRARGDAALAEYTERFDGARVERPLRPIADYAEIGARCAAEIRALLEGAGARIRAYHEHQVDSGFGFERDGVRLGMRVRPVASAGVYAPGGKARYPSTVLMTAVPAKVAGVRRI